MANLQWPTDICPSSFLLQCEPNVRAFSSLHQVPEPDVDLLEDKWRVTLSVDGLQGRQAAKLETLSNRLSGGFHTIDLHHFARPNPRGTATSSTGLVASVSKGSRFATITVSPSATLLAGDMLSIGGQLMQVVEDAVASAGGVLDLQFVNYFRQDITAPSTVVLVKPTARFWLTSSSGNTYTPTELVSKTFTFEEHI